MTSRVVILFIAISTTVMAQIPNAGFENWTTANGYDIPAGWDNLNAMTASKSVFTCTKGTPGSSGNAYLSLVSDSVKGMGVVPGIAVSGKLNMITLKPKSGFAYNKRPASLKGKWQFMAPGDDHGFVAVYFTKWNIQAKKRDTIGSGKSMLDGMSMSWVAFDIPISFSTSANPDSSVIILSASGSTPLQYSYLFVDELAFNGTAGVNEKKEQASSFKIISNPVTNTLQLDLSTLKEVQSIQLIDMVGKIVGTLTLNRSDSSIDVSNLFPGIYFVSVSTGKGLVTQRFSKL